MQIGMPERQKIAEASEILAVGWNALAQSGIVTGMRAYEHESLKRSITTVLEKIVEKMPEDGV